MQGSRFRVQGSGFRMQGSEVRFRVQGSEFRVQGSGSGVWGMHRPPQHSILARGALPPNGVGVLPHDM